MEAACSSRVCAVAEMAQAFWAVHFRYDYDHVVPQHHTQQQHWQQQHWQQQQQQEQHQQAAYDGNNPECTSFQCGDEDSAAGPTELRIRRPGGRPSSFEHWMAVAAPEKQSYAFAEAPPMSSYVFPKEETQPHVLSGADVGQEATEPHGDVHFSQREEEPPVLLNRRQAVQCEKGTKEVTAESLCQHLLQYDLKGAAAQPTSEASTEVSAYASTHASTEASAEASPTNKHTEMNLDTVLDAIGTEQGILNWALLDPVKLNLHASGTDGLEEMTKHLAEDRVLFGVLRLSFASGSDQHPRSRLEKRLERHHSTPYFAEADSPSRGTKAPRITRHIFVHWVGPRVSAVRRGQWNARCPQAMSQVAAHCAVIQRRTAHGLNDLRLEDIVEDLRRLSALGAADDTLGLSRISVDGYHAGLRQEAFLQHWLPGLTTV
jgi:hypothetical protein